MLCRRLATYFGRHLLHLTYRTPPHQIGALERKSIQRDPLLYFITFSKLAAIFSKEGMVKVYTLLANLVGINFSDKTSNILNQ